MSVNNTKSRVKNSFRNTVFGFLGLLLYQVFNFATVPYLFVYLESNTKSMVCENLIHIGYGQKSISMI